jgi:hypothetical protein
MYMSGVMPPGHHEKWTRRKTCHQCLDMYRHHSTKSPEQSRQFCRSWISFKILLLQYKSAPAPRYQLCTASSTASFSPCWSLGDLSRPRRGGAKSGLYGACGSTSQPFFATVYDDRRAVWGPASCWRMTSLFHRALFMKCMLQRFAPPNIASRMMIPHYR